MILDLVSINLTDNNNDCRSNVGGIATSNSGIIRNCGVNSGNIKATNPYGGTSSTYNNLFIGGIVSYIQSTGKVYNCYNKANITGICTVTGNGYNQPCVGGIWGSSHTAASSDG